jgi:hypothetical protein
MKIIKPDSEDQSPVGIKIFLAGSIEMGSAINWQSDIEKHLEHFGDVTLYNPRRNNWDSSWEQTPDNPKFVEQVNWELDKLEESDIVFFYFDPATKSPISLLEFGMYTRCSPIKVVCCCPDGFWRKGNLQITGTKYGVNIINDFKDAKEYLFHEIVIYFLKKEIEENGN